MALGSNAKITKSEINFSFVTFSNENTKSQTKVNAHLNRNSKLYMTRRACLRTTVDRRGTRGSRVQKAAMATMEWSSS